MTHDYEVWLYGSRARGNADAHSDTDLLVVGDGEDVVPEAIAGIDFPKVNVSFYSWTEIEHMRDYGSLFLCHIAEEGVQLRRSGSAERLSASLDRLPPFSRGREDLAGFRHALREGRESLDQGGWPDFECGVIATVARHAAILGAYCSGRPTFGREEPFRVAGACLGYAEETIEALTGPATYWRVHRPGAGVATDGMTAWLNLVQAFLEDIEEVVDDYQRVLPVAA